MRSIKNGIRAKGLLFVIFTFSFTLSFSQLLVLKGDNPDPSVVKIGNSYYASATTSNWFPALSLFQSSDLVHWQQHGYIFNQLPEWADYYFWAPELSYDNNKVWVYYAAHKKGGNLCIGVASADNPLGPYKDLGPLVCQADGSIDAFPQRDENGKLYLIWKEDGNSVKKPTSIWAQQMSESRTSLIGQKVELFRNDKKWEANLVEGVSIIKHGKYFYALFAGAGCCGFTCDYAVGVARSTNLLGPWEKYNGNPILKNSNNWICAGHGTTIEMDGKYYFLHHAYDKNSAPFTGRQGILSSFRFTENDWIEFIPDKQSITIDKPIIITDQFEGNKLSDNWQWSIFQKPVMKISNRSLELFAKPGITTYVGQKITSGDYVANITVDAHTSSASSGIGIIGDDKNYIAAFYNHGSIQVVKVIQGKEEVSYKTPVSSQNKITLQVKVNNSKDIFFEYTSNNKQVVLNKIAVDGKLLPPWDRAVRIGLLTKGTNHSKSVFRNFQMHNLM